MKLVILLFFILPTQTFGQLATFYADTSRLRAYVGHHEESFQQAMEMQWIIKGKELRWGGPPIEVSPAITGVDTIFFKELALAEWDTLICKMRGGTSTTFKYNACCNYFDVMDQVGDRVEGRVSFILKGAKQGKKKYFGSIDGNGIHVSSTAQIISPINRSPMLPNSFNVAVREIRKCKGKECLEAAIQKPNGSLDISFRYAVVYDISRFNYLPLSIDPIAVSYNLNSSKMSIE